MAHEPRNLVDRIAVHLRNHLVGAQDQVALVAHDDGARGVAVAVGFAHAHGHHEVGKLVEALLQIGRLAIVFEGEASAERHHFGRPFHAGHQQKCRHAVGPQVGQLAARIIPEPAEVVQPAVRLVGLLGRRPEPQVVIEIGRRILHRRLAETRIDIAAAGSQFHHLDLAQRAAFDRSSWPPDGRDCDSAACPPPPSACTCSSPGASTCLRR